MKLTYYLHDSRKKNLYCRINDGSDRVVFSLGYAVDKTMWDAKKSELTWEDPYYYALSDFKKYLEIRFHELKAANESDVLNRLKIEADSFVEEDGIAGIAKGMFDLENQDSDVPRYDQFMAAFEKHTGSSKGQYVARTIDNLIEFHTKNDEVWRMDTYAGLTARLKGMIDRRSYDEIYTMTELAYWSEIYIDAGIEKHHFLPLMLSNWEGYWQEKYTDIKVKVGKTDHLDEMKEASWRQFQVYMECYDSAGDSIELAYHIDDMKLYPIAVITMMSIFDAGVCYTEYCELEFDGSGEWESVCVNDEDEYPLFYIRPADD